MSKRNFFVLLLVTACFVWAIANTAEAGKPPEPICGNGICEKKESRNCPKDCEPPPPNEIYCGDTECNGDETCSSCDVDCGDCPQLSLGDEKSAAHDGDAVRAVGFANYEAEETWIVSGGEDAHLRYWDLDLNEQLDQALNHTIYDLESSVDWSIVVTGEGGWNGHANSDTLRIWNADGTYVGTQAPIGFVYCVAISPSPDNLWTVASGFYGDIVVYKTDTLELIETKATKKHRTKALAFSPYGSVLASTSTAGRIQLWSFPKEECTPGLCELDLLLSLSHSGSWSFPIAFKPKPDNSTPDETEIVFVSGTDSGMIKVWTIKDLLTSPDVYDLSVDSRAVYCLAWSPDGTKIVAGGNGDITVYHAGTLEIQFQNVDAHSGRVNDVAFSPDGSQIVSGGADGALKLWDLVGDP